MSEETKNENNEEVEETSEDVETEEEAEESAESEETEESSDENASDDASDKDDSDDEGDSDDDAADEGDSDDEAADEGDSDEEAADEGDSDDDAADEGDSDDDAADDDAAADEGDTDAAAEHFGEPDSPVRRSGSESVDEIDVEAGDHLDVGDGEEDPHTGLLTGEHVEGIAAYFDHPDHLLYAAAQTRDSSYEAFDAFSPFPIHGMDDALGLGRSWIPWVTFGAGCAGFMTAVGLQFGIMGFDWPMNFGGKPFIAWPSFVPIMFELTVLFAGVTTGLVMLKAAGCFQKPFIIDTEITNDRFVLWISANDENFDREGVIEFMKELNPSEIRTIKKDA